jgi:diguanylate cyclase (GGDEF)-like protein
MAMIPDEKDAAEAQAPSTSLDPYGQLMKMLMPRALCIAIYDQMSTPLWMSDGHDGHDLLQLAEEALNSARGGSPDPEERDGFARSWDGDTAYVFVLRDGSNLLGAVAVSTRDGGSGARPFSLLLGLLKPALQVLGRELSNQYSVADLQKNLTLREGDLKLLLDASGGAEGADSNDFDQMLANCVGQFECTFGALLVPDNGISVTRAAKGKVQPGDAELLEKAQQHLLTWAQVQRRTLMMNKPAPAGSPLGGVPYKILACPIKYDAQNIAGVLALFRPMTSADFETRQIRFVEMVARRAVHVLQNAFDPATGLLTRPALEQRAFAMLSAAGERTPHCVAYGDIDRLHAVNESHGMHVGDLAIAKVGETMRTNLLDMVTAARVTGDRFALFFTNTPVETAKAFLESLCRIVAETDFSHDSQKIELSMSFGLAAIRDTKYPLSHALAAAEVACQGAKEGGRSRVNIYKEVERITYKEAQRKRTTKSNTPKAAAEAPQTEDNAVAVELRDAIAHDRFCMEAQPIVELNGSSPVRRYELLLRMIDGAGERIAPDQFLAAAERHQLAPKIDRWVVQYALEILSSAAPALQNMGAHFAINISGQSVSDQTFPGFLEEKLREYELPASLLSFEISESAAVANVAHAEKLIRRLRDLGHEVALDDFGKDQSARNHLKSLPVTSLKIDGALIRDAASNSNAQAKVTAVVELAKSMKISTTAECIESLEIQSAVANLGVDYGQGFAIGRPRPLEVSLQELLSGGSTASASRSGGSRLSRLAG